MYQEYCQLADRFIYDMYSVTGGIDGWGHIKHTVRFGTMIAAGENPDLIFPVVLGCYLHDVGRGKEEPGERHGDAGYRFLKEQEDTVMSYFKRFGLTHELYNEIIMAIKDHDKGLVTSDVLTGSIWDADRLSLYRFKDKHIKIELLSTDSARRLLHYADSFTKDFYLDFK